MKFFRPIAKFVAAIGQELADMWKDGVEGKIVAVIMVGCALFIAAIPFFIYFDNQDLDAWKAWCGEQGDTRIETTEETGLMLAGKTTMVTTDTTYYCLASDGAVLDIRD